MAERGKIRTFLPVGRDPQPPPDSPRRMELAKRFGLEFLPLLRE